jgi:hypothetical protein
LKPVGNQGCSFSIQSPPRREQDSIRVQHGSEVSEGGRTGIESRSFNSGNYQIQIILLFNVILAKTSRMDYTLLNSPSVGSLVKKMIAINPDLGVVELANLIRSASRLSGKNPEGATTLHTVDEELALEYTRATLTKQSN